MKRSTLSILKFCASLVACALGIWGFDALSGILPKWLFVSLLVVLGTMWFRWFLKDIIKAAIREAWED